MMNLEVNKDGILGTKGPERTRGLTISGLVLILLGFIGSLLFTILHLWMVIAGVAVGFGRRVCVDFEKSRVINKYSYHLIPYFSEEKVLEQIGRKSGEQLTDHHTIYVTTIQGEEVVLFENNRFAVDEKWEEIKEHTHDHFLKEYEQPNEDESV